MQFFDINWCRLSIYIIISMFGVLSLLNFTLHQCHRISVYYVYMALFDTV